MKKMSLVLVGCYDSEYLVVVDSIEGDALRGPYFHLETGFNTLECGRFWWADIDYLEVLV
jgi:hypothetical protein